MSEQTTYTIDELREKLTEKERKFCHFYIRHWNGSKAAREAGYSQNSCAEIAYENLRKPHIKQYIDIIKTDIEKEVGLSKIRVVEEQMKIAFSSVGYLHNSWIERTDFEKLTQEQKGCIETIKTKVIKKNIGTKKKPKLVDVEYIEIKLYDKTKALEAIARMMGYNEPDKIDHTSKGEKINTRIDISKLNEDNKNFILELLNINARFD